MLNCTCSAESEIGKLKQLTLQTPIVLKFDTSAQQFQAFQFSIKIYLKINSYNLVVVYRLRDTFYQFRIHRNLRIDIKDRLEEYSQFIIFVK